MIAAPDATATLKLPAGTPITERVKAQLERDYPPGALSWVDGLSWGKGTVQVPVGQIDQTRGDTDWKAAAANKLKLQSMRRRILAGWRKPVCLVRTPGQSRLFAVDGHSRILSCEAIGQPVTAWVGTATTAHGAWEKAHARQLASDAGAVELTAETPAASTVPHPFGSPSGPGLWRVKGMQLDPYVQNVARALLRKGRARDRSQAIRMAYGLIQDWAAGRTPNGKGHVHPDVQAAAARSLASMNAKRAAAHAHASDAPAVDLAGMWNEQAHPRVAKGHAGGGRFGSGGAPIAAPPQGGRGPRLAPPPPAPAPEPRAEVTRIRQLRFQASQDRHLARQIMLKIQALIRIRDAYIAGLVTPTGLPRKPVNPARSAAAKKAATTRKRNPAPRKKGVRSSTPGGAKAANVAKMNGQISTLRNDARALIKSANKLNAMANGL